ncbi:hypothetical protein BDGGKGIB_00985 [Nodularia sphaerocarpa UHCC 0038]|nr:hypothetical protein BDGGKGIB_00985 [Nodularia sphaerocarpa UHCC 0038]
MFDMRALFSALYFVSFEASILLTAAVQPVVAQPLSTPEKSIGQLPILPSGAVDVPQLLQPTSPPSGAVDAPPLLQPTSPPSGAVDVPQLLQPPSPPSGAEGFNDQVGAELSRYLLGPGDVLALCFSARLAPIG